MSGAVDQDCQPVVHDQVPDRTFGPRPLLVDWHGERLILRADAGREGGGHERGGSVAVRSGDGGARKVFRSHLPAAESAEGPCAARHGGAPLAIRGRNLIGGVPGDGRDRKSVV